MKTAAAGKRERGYWSSQLRASGIRPTLQRRRLAEALFATAENRHVTAEGLFEEVSRQGTHISLATVYNTLHLFADKGLLRALKVAPDRIWFDTRTDPHYHFLHIEDGRLEDIGPQDVAFAALPQAPDGARIDGVDVVIRVRSTK